MRFYWIHNRVQQKQFNIYWAPGKQNLADYYTKHHSATHHQQIRSLYLHTTPMTNTINSAIAQALHVLRGCVKPALQNTALPRAQGSQNPQASTQAHRYVSMPAETTVLSRTCRAAEPTQQACREIPFLACSLVSKPSCLLALIWSNNSFLHRSFHVLLWHALVWGKGKRVCATASRYGSRCLAKVT
jgi:hypothetical protein